MSEPPLVLPLADAGADLALTGGKGASLARMAAAGLPVPPGFHVTTEAYERFVAENSLRDAILSAVADAAGGSYADAERAIGRLFAEHDIPEPVGAAIREAYSALGGPAVAVRSSATAEDLPGLSFAGQQETYLDVQGDDALLAAVKRCWASLWGARAIAYRTRGGVAQDEVSMAVVVQRLVPADAAGVLFTADPVTGARDRMVVNAAWGLGEAVVGGQVTPDTVVVGRPGGAVLSRRTGDKAVMTVRTGGGTAEVAVPEARRTMEVLDAAQVATLADLGERVEELYGHPMDVEWAFLGGRPSILQARPITGLDAAESARAAEASPTSQAEAEAAQAEAEAAQAEEAAQASHAQAEEAWNDSLGGDYLWSNGNLGEAIPDVMTPSTYSFVEIFMSGAMRASSVAEFRAYGRIGGRFYMNLSLAATIATTFGMGKRFAAFTEPVFGRLPAGMEIPLVPVSRWRMIKLILPAAIAVKREVRANARRLPEFFATAPRRCERLREHVAATSTAAGLAALWRSELGPYLLECSHMLEAATRQDTGALGLGRVRLAKLVGESEIAALGSGLHGGESGLASLGLLVGLDRLSRGEIDRDVFAREWGHRGPSEFEVSIPRPGEDPRWIDARLAGLRGAEHDVDALIARQSERRAAAWRRLAERHPRQVSRARRTVARMTKALRDREVARSEVVRAFWTLRAYVLRAGEITGHGDDLFFLSADEILAVLDAGSPGGSPLAAVAGRRRLYERYRALPPYPALIRGRFDPFRWAADPLRRGDVYDEHDQGAPADEAVTGFPGASGVVEGRVRVISGVEEGETLRPGEILVTTVTNVGWTPLFPRAAAVVTDVGAPLSHAAIVARELGIPAVVGCGNATTRLRTGDLVRVDGRHGTVEVLQAAPA
ncbi:PEP/pyruvate-binding domain-containing protein [Sphaerisporangium dianthi]|uniref:PEP/pyruvate-binding domain-containing protein n=1 Tax=Sphaerisporangium dianthi TaxID=1436120 RepID=A0ABV9CDQ0_9ACTN